MAKPTIEFKNGKKIVTYPSGEKREHSKEGLTTAKQMFLKRREKIDEQISLINEDIKKIG